MSVLGLLYMMRAEHKIEDGDVDEDVRRMRIMKSSRRMKVT